MFLGGKSREAVIGTNDFPAYPQNKNSCAHAVRNQPVVAPFSAESRFLYEPWDPVSEINSIESRKI